MLKISIKIQMKLVIAKVPSCRPFLQFLLPSQISVCQIGTNIVFNHIYLVWCRILKPVRSKVIYHHLMRIQKQDINYYMGRQPKVLKKGQIVDSLELLQSI